METKVVNKNLLLLSTLLSVFCIIAIFFINQQIAIRYQQSDGKTKALFGIVEWLSFSYKYYLLIPAILGLLVGIKAYQTEAKKIIPGIAIVLACLTIIVIFLRIWKVMI